MKKVFLAVAVAAVAVAVAVPAAMGGSTPKLTGGGGSPGADPNGNHPFFVNVTAQGAAPNATGNFTFTRADGSFGGPVNCFYIKADGSAWASGPITAADGNFGGQVGQGFVVGVKDNGQGAAASPDNIQVDIYPPSATLCSDYANGANGWFPYNVTTGNFQIH